MHLDLDVASAAGNTSTSQAVTPTAGFSNRHGAAGVAAPSIAAAAASSMRGASATGMSPASAMLAASATASPAGTGGGVPYAELLPQPAAAAWPQEHCLPEQPASNTNTPSSQTRNVLSQHQLQPLVEAVGQEAGSVASRMSHGSRDRDADGATAQHVHSTSGSMGGGVGRISADADATLHSSPSGGPRARLGRVLVQTGADASVAEAAAAATTENGIAGGAAGAGINTTAGSRSSSLRHSHLLARGAAELARLQQQIQHQQPGTLTPSQQRGGGAGAGSFGVPASSGRGGGGGSSRALRTTPFASAVLMSHSATANAGAAGAVIIGAAAQLAGAAEDAGGAGGASASALAAALTSASAFTRLSATAAMTATESTTGTQSRVASAGTGRRRSCSLARGTPAGATSASGGQASYGTLEHRSLSLVGLGSAAHAGQSRTTLTLSDLLLGLNGGHDEGGHGGHGGGGGGAGTYELWQVLAATGALPGRYCTLVVMEVGGWRAKCREGVVPVLVSVLDPVPDFGSSSSPRPGPGPGPDWAGPPVRCEGQRQWFFCLEGVRLPHSFSARDRQSSALAHRVFASLSRPCPPPCVPRPCSPPDVRPGYAADEGAAAALSRRALGGGGG